MAMTKQQFENLEPAHQQALHILASKFGFHVLHLNPDDAQPIKPTTPHWAEQQRIAAEIKSERLRANPIRHEPPTAEQAKVLAQKLGLNVKCIRTAEQAASEATQNRIQELVDSKDTAKLIVEFGQHADPTVRQVARQHVRELWPAFEQQIGWKD